MRVLNVGTARRMSAVASLCTVGLVVDSCGMVTITPKNAGEPTAGTLTGLPSPAETAATDQPSTANESAQTSANEQGAKEQESKQTPLQQGARLPREVRERALSMTVPEICAQKGGTLVNGELPRDRIIGTDGYLNILTNTAAPDLADQVQGGVGDFDGNGTLEYAILFNCWAGGVGWPQSIFIFDQDLNLVGPGPQTNGYFPENIARQPYTIFEVTPGSVFHLEFEGHDPDNFQGECCPTVRYDGKFSVGPGSDLIPVNPPRVTPLPRP